MNITGILSLFSNKDLIHTLTFSEKMSGVFATICIGMGITFLVLIVLQYLIVIMSVLIVRLSNDNGKKQIELEKETLEREKNKKHKNLIIAILAAVTQQFEEDLKLK